MGNRSGDPAHPPRLATPRDPRGVGWTVLRVTAIACGLLFAFIALSVYLTQGSPAAAQNNYMPRPTFIFILGLGVACVAAGALGSWIIRLTRRFRWRPLRVAVMTRGSNVVTIRTYERRVLWILAVATLGFFAVNGLWSGPQWLQHLPARLADGYLAGVSILVLAGLWRAWHIALQVDDGGVTVRNLLRSYRLSWPEVASFADGAAIGGQSQTYWALTVVTCSGDALIAAATTRSGGPRPELLAAIRQAADRYGVQAQITGRHPPARGFYLDPGGQPGVRYFGGKTWSPLLPPHVAGSRQPATVSDPVTWYLPEARSWVVGRKAVRFFAVWLVLCTAATGVLLASAAGMAPWSDRAAHDATTFLYWAAFTALGAITYGFRLRLWIKLKRAATEAAATPSK